MKYSNLVCLHMFVSIQMYAFGMFTYVCVNTDVCIWYVLHMFVSIQMYAFGMFYICLCQYRCMHLVCFTFVCVNTLFSVPLTG